MSGHTVYSCYQLTIPATLDANQHSCIAKTGSTYAYKSVGAAASVVHVEQFLSPDHKIWCELSTTPGVQQTWCGYGGANPGAGPQHSGTLHPNGQVSLCQPSRGPNSICMQNWNPAAPVLPPGSSDELYRYRCSSQTGAITCIVTSGPGKGKGFTITDAGVTKVG